ncbi:MAG: hypothetical protein WCF72_20370, partial [Pseudolabrys sp.]
ARVATIPLTRSTCTMVVYNHFGSFITLSPKIARDLALRACGFLRKVGRILRQGSELRENAIDWRFDCSFGRLLPYSAAGHAGAMHFERLHPKDRSASTGHTEANGIQVRSCDCKRETDSSSDGGA